MVDKKDRTIARSFRVKEKWIDNMKEEAAREGITVNALLNKILEDYSIFHRHFARLDGMSFSKNTVSFFLEKYPKEDLSELGKVVGSNALKDLFVAFGLRVNYDNVIFFISKILAKYGNWFTYEQHTQNNKDIFHLRHSLGKKMSVFAGELISTFFISLNMKIEMKLMNNVITIIVFRD